MQAMGFQGFQPFSALTAALVPTGPRVYCVVRAATGEPAFLPRSPAGHFKGNDPTAPVAELKQLWVTGSEVIYLSPCAVLRRLGRGCSACWLFGVAERGGVVVRRGVVGFRCIA